MIGDGLFCASDLFGFMLHKQPRVIDVGLRLLAGVGECPVIGDLEAFCPHARNKFQYGVTPGGRGVSAFGRHIAQRGYGFHERLQGTDYRGHLLNVPQTDLATGREFVGDNLCSADQFIEYFAHGDSEFPRAV